jgi:GNAT superfamily N-acetyltransferase
VAERVKVEIGPLKESELEEADRIMRTAFGTFLGLPEPGSFAGDRHFVKSRWGGKNVKWLAARDGKRLIGSNGLTRWGSFGFFGPLTVLPEYWDRGVAQQLLDATVKQFDKWGVKQTGLFTFPHSTKHVGLYQRYGYWPQYLTALMTRTPAADETAREPVLLSGLSKAEQKQAVKDCAKLAGQVEKGLDVTEEIGMWCWSAAGAGWTVLRCATSVRVRWGARRFATCSLRRRVRERVRASGLKRC